MSVPAPAFADAGDLLVRFGAAADARDRGDARRDAGVRREAGLPVQGTERVAPLRGVTAAAAADRLNRNPDVLYAEPDRTRSASMTTSDPSFGAQWALTQINAPAAWDVTVGSRSVLVAVVDSGVDASHPDLAGNLTAGWDFVDDDAIPDDETEDGHGTHVTGVIGAASDNGIGVSGVNWNAQMMPLRVLGANRKGALSDEVLGVARAVASGARVVNLSMSGEGFLPDRVRRDRRRRGHAVRGRRR